MPLLSPEPTTRNLGPGRRALARALLAVAGVAIGLGLAEAGFRLATTAGCESFCELSGEQQAHFGWRHIPGERGWCQQCLRGQLEWRTYTRISERGLRDREIPYERQGGFRILVLGDSFTEGLQVDQERTFPKLLEQRLNAARPPGAPAFEVINAGVWGWSTDNQLLYFLHEGWKYRADLVLLAFYTGNDVIENHRQMMRALNAPYPDKPYFEIDAGRLALRHHPLPPESRLHRFARFARDLLRRHSALYRYLAELRLPRVPAAAQAAAREEIASPPALEEIYLTRPPRRWREAWRITRRLVRRLRDAVEATGSRFAVVVINRRDEVSERWRWLVHRKPHLRDAPRDFDRPNRLITQFLASAGISTIPLLAEFRSRFGADGAAFFPWDSHWAPAGHELAAELIERSLRELGLVPVPPDPPAPADGAS